MSIELRPAELSDINLVIEHDRRHMKEPGFNGSLSHPFLPDHEFDWEQKKIDKFNAWNRALSEERWARSFIAIDGNKVLGHVHLNNLFSGTLHRAQLGMGLELELRGQGIGTKLLTLAIDWAKDQDSLHWIDLSYFSHNTPARKLYTSCGFVELFTYVDRLRVGQHRIDDVFMSLKLK
ncbi:MAG: GNAT family N-acetyltransferase [Bdellovibrionales bacterium]|nr:GNAT family N-acetyltransferase [Bdellovibrionales bacterium]